VGDAERDPRLKKLDFELALGDAGGGSLVLPGRRTGG